ncbi:MAG TPA: DNA repair exonuclease [Gemmatimonadaceae bacterium]
MRLVHLSDLHLGFRQFQRLTPRGINQREHDVAQTFKLALNKIIELAPELVLVAGDVFHQVRPTNTAIVLAYVEFARLRRELPDTEIVMIAGNHDTPRSLELVCILRLFRSLGIHVVESNADALEFPALDATVLAVPSSAFGRQKLVPTGALRWNVLLMHGPVEGEIGPYSPPTGIPRQEIPQRDLNAEQWDYIALGEYHTFRKIAPNQFYSGATDYTSNNVWGEKIEESLVHVPGKGLIEFDLDTGSHVFHTLTPSRVFMDLPVIRARGRTAEEINTLIRDTVDGCPGGIDDKVVRLVVHDIPRHIARQLDQRLLRDYRQRALHFQFDPRRPEPLPTMGNGAPGRRPSLMDVVRDKLRERVVPADVDRDALVELGVHYLREAEERETYTTPVLGAEV